jgi:UDP-N-acetylmuramate--alanine ligase
MIELKDIKVAYFLGIGGIGMSAIARYFAHLGISVYGYDKTETPLTKQLSDEGMQIHYEDLPVLVQTLNLNINHTLVVLTPAIPSNHQEWAWLKANGFIIQKRSEVLGTISRSYKTIGVAGTHGKTTTSTMVAHLLTQSHVGCNAFLGGISTNYNTNLLLHERSAELPTFNQYNVVEADEFDRSFLTLSPTLAVITSTDADHLDIYGEHQAMKDSFLAYSKKVFPDGMLFVKVGLEIISDLTGNYQTYGISEAADNYAFNIKIDEDKHEFDLNLNGTIITDVQLGIPGLHNIENAVAAAALALKAGLTSEEIKLGLASFDGVKRRFQYIIKEKYRVFIDDYAHHPEEIKAILTSVKRMYPHQKMVVVFQPHLYSRTRDFEDEFASSLSLADQLFLLDIYPARELPIPGVSAQMLLRKATCEQKELCSKEVLIERLASLQPGLLLTLGAGDIDALVEPIKQKLS